MDVATVGGAHEVSTPPAPQFVEAIVESDEVEVDAEVEVVAEADVEPVDGPVNDPVDESVVGATTELSEPGAKKPGPTVTNDEDPVGCHEVSIGGGVHPVWMVGFKVEESPAVELVEVGVDAGTVAVLSVAGTIGALADTGGEVGAVAELAVAVELLAGSAPSRSTVVESLEEIPEADEDAEVDEEAEVAGAEAGLALTAGTSISSEAERSEASLLSGALGGLPGFPRPVL